MCVLSVLGQRLPAPCPQWESAEDGDHSHFAHCLPRREHTLRAQRTAGKCALASGGRWGASAGPAPPARYCHGRQGERGKGVQPGAAVPGCQGYKFPSWGRCRGDEPPGKRGRLRGGSRGRGWGREGAPGSPGRQVALIIPKDKSPPTPTSLSSKVCRIGGPGRWREAVGAGGLGASAVTPDEWGPLCNGVCRCEGRGEGSGAEVQSGRGLGLQIQTPGVTLGPCCVARS